MIRARVGVGRSLRSVVWGKYNPDPWELYFRPSRSLLRKANTVVGLHASERLEERGVLEWQVVDGLESAALLAERPNDKPHPAIEVEQVLPDGTALKAVWSLISADIAKLVTVHFFN
jgi:uncharacterized protein DUF4258